VTIHGEILGATIATPDIGLAIADYRDLLGLQLVEQVPLSADIARSWVRPRLAGRASATLRPASGADCAIRLVEQPVPQGYRPTTTFGWNAFEISVQRVFEWPAKLEASGFEIVGPPKEIEGLPYFVAMQVVGRGGEMLYLNEVRSNTPTSDLPAAQSISDRVFIVILGVSDFEQALGWYTSALGLDEGGRYEIVYSMINRAFDLPEVTKHRLAMAQKGRMPIVEIDAYPPAATARSGDPGLLPAGNALVSLAVESLDALSVDWLSPPANLPGLPYAGARAATCIGPGGELLELIERAG